MTALDVEARLDALFSGPLEEFVAARDALAREVAAQGDDVASARIRRLRRPTVAAWAVNQVARTHAEEIAALAALGDELRAATADRDRARIRALDHLRRERTEALTGPLRAAREIGGRQVSADVLDRLGETLTAVVMDAAAAAAVRAGRLAQALRHVGFGVVDEGGEEADVAPLRAEPRAAAAPRSGAAAADGERGTDAASSLDAEPAAGGRAAGQEARDAALRAADRAVEEAAAEVDRLEARRDDVEARVRRARKEGQRVAAELERLTAELDRLSAERDAARHASDVARQEEDGARAELAAVEAELDEAERQAAAARRTRRAASRTR